MRFAVISHFTLPWVYNRAFWISITCCHTVDMVVTPLCLGSLSAVSPLEGISEVLLSVLLRVLMSVLLVCVCVCD